MEILLKRLQQKARSRKKHLFAKYSELISSFETAQNIIETIHEELGQENLVTVSDIYYCRRHFVKQKTWKLAKNSRKKELSNTHSIQNKSSNFDDLIWTDPATIKNTKLRSKFAPPDND